MLNIVLRLPLILREAKCLVIYGASLLNFPARLIQLRKAADLTQQTLADLASIHVNQIRRYEAGSAQPTLDALIRLAKVLRVSLDSLVFDDHERGPSDDLALQFEAVSGMPEEERRIIKALLDGMILKYQAKQITERG
ncbi:helix-turn-helix transcriptional regulator [Enterobacteriaceae bacterium YMB-R21]|uniref:Helix-turn-helix transcriptional regulator n=1 Tax=Tenebrionicola larvae TaxID=2815733 RepID=A0A949V5U2_9ENTR|nr:helix-turn-helix transcriptional regulator [Tenebrionicola larvae]